MKYRQIRNLKKYILPNLNDAEWGYIAGWIDGEASITHIKSYASKNGDIFHTRISATHTHLPTLEWLTSKLKVGFIYENNSLTLGKKQKYRWDISPRLAIYKILQRIYPFLIEKKEKAKLMLEFLHDFLSKGGRLGDLE